MLHFVTWLWGDKYSHDYLTKLEAGLKRNVKQPYRFIIARPKTEEDFKLTSIPGCFVRLQMFSAKWQSENGIAPGERVVQIDIDSILTGKLDPLFDRPEPFVILQGANHQPCRFNGCLSMLRAGSHPEIWECFSLEAAQKIPYHTFPDDQGWLWHHLPDAAGWQTGSSSGCYVYQKPGWITGEKLPIGARYVTFAGKRRPDLIAQLDWVKEHWR